MTVQEWNLMPMNHIDERSCEQSPNSDCVEIPNVPITPGRNCDTTINDPDECRIIVFLNGTFVFEGLTLGGLSNDEFTMAMNTSNMTIADLTTTYPPLEGLRVDVFKNAMDEVSMLKTMTIKARRPYQELVLQMKQSHTKHGLSASMEKRAYA